MAIADTLAGSLKINLSATLTRINDGDLSGTDSLGHSISKIITNGSSTNQATCWLNEQVTVTTGATTISLADSADPFAAIGDEVPTADPEGLKLRLLLIENLDATNFVTLAEGANALADMLGGTSPTVKIYPGGVFLWSCPPGGSAINDGADDEITLQADTASCEVKVTALFG